MKKLESRGIASSVAGAILLGSLAALPLRAQNYPTQLQSKGPADYWRLNETVPSPAINSVANLGSAGAAGTGYVVGTVTLGAPGVVGGAALISNTGQNVGNCPGRIDIPNIPALNPKPPFAIEFWMKPNAPFTPSDSTGLAPISAISVDGTPNYEGARSGYVFYVNPTSVAFRAGGLQSYTFIATASKAVPTTSWTHVVGEFDGSTATLYLNGVLAASTPVTGGPFLPDPFQPIRIGGTALPGASYEDGNANVVVGSGNRGWDGYVDKVAIYSNILSSSTVLSHYSAGTNASSTYDATILASQPVGYWNLNEPAYVTPTPSNTLAADYGYLGDNGTNTLGTLAGQSGVPGLSADAKSVYYNGVAGSLALDTSVAPVNVAGKPLTLAAWIKPDSFGYVQDIIAQGYDEKNYAENFLRTGDSYDWAALQNDNSGGNYNTNVVPGVAYYEIGTYNGGNGYVSAVIPAPAGDIGHWVFLAGTYDGQQWNLYRNGQPVAQFADGGVGPSLVQDSLGNLHPWAVGSRSNPNPYFGMFFAGSIEEACIITNALDAADILSLYDSVQIPPVITVPPVAPSPVYLGSAVSFSVGADGPGTLYYQWSSNGVPVSGATSTSFALSGLTAAADGTYSVVVTNLYGSATSSVVLFVTPTLPPAVLTSETRWLGSPFSLAPVSLPNQQLSYQWDLNGSPVGGATQSSYTGTTTTGNAGSYTLVISNNFGVSTSTVATLSYLTPPNVYVSTIIGDQPLTFLRLDEKSGTVAHDYAGGNNGSYVGGVALGAPGYSLVDTDTAAFFSGAALEYVGGIGSSAINFGGTSSQFTIEAWANGGATQGGGAAVVAKGHSNNGTIANEQFAIIINGGSYAFFVRDTKGNAVVAQSTFVPDGNWHLLDGVCSEQGGGLSFYIDGQLAATASTGSLINGIVSSANPVTIGSESSGPGPTYDLPYEGTISQVAIYASALSSVQVSNHYAAAYGPNLPPFITIAPVSVTNYVNLPVTVSVSAAGTVPLTYQWNKVGSGPISGATANIFTISNLAYTDAGTYTVGITNTIQGNVVTGILSAPITITVLTPPSTPPSLSGLVMHLPFNGNLLDATGRGNNATNEASGGIPVVTNDYTTGQIGQAFTYQTTVDGSTTNANYASIGVRSDLQFSSNVSFTVSFWIQTPLYFSGNDLPFFTDTVGSTFGTGYVFAPSFFNGGAAPNWPGSWAFSIYDVSGVGTGVYGYPNDINDGNFHNLVYVIDRKAGATVYLDGVAATQYAQSGSSVATAGDIDTTNAATIGQDPTGLYPQPSAGPYGNTFAINDLGVWRRALTPLEAASIFEAGAVNQVSFTGAPVSFTGSVLANHSLVMNWNEGNLQSATDLRGPWTTLTVTSPYTNSPSGSSKFFRVKF